MEQTEKEQLHIFVGIDPSINSTGMCVSIDRYKGKVINFYHLYNIKSKQTKKEALQLKDVMSKSKNGGPVSVVMYNYTDPNIYNKKDKNRDQHKFEIAKTQNLINITNEIKDILLDVILNSLKIEQVDSIKLHVCIEATAYGASARTVSLMDLCGLNYLIRNMVLSLPNTLLHNLNVYNNIEVELICAPPTEIKKFATNRGDADKELMLFCFSLLQVDIYEIYRFMKLDDMADAHFMQLYSYYKYNKDIDLYNELSLTNLYSDLHKMEIRNKINETKNLKREKKLTIKNGKNKQSVWDSSMADFADNV